MTTFATNTINNSQNAIDRIQDQIAKLQALLTETQASHQQILGAEQKGLSAMEQYKEAIAAIAALNEQEMLQAFLKEMAAITAQALGEPAIANLSGTDETEPEPEPEPNKPTEPELGVDESESTEPELGDNEPEPAKSNESKPEPTESEQSYKEISWDGLRNFCRAHDIKTGKKSRPKVEAALANAGHKPDDIRRWMSEAA